MTRLPKRTPSLPLSALGWGLILCATGAVLCFVPLFNVVGYESSLALALLASAAGLFLGATALCQERARRTWADAALADARPLSALLRPLGRALLAALLALLPPLLLLLGNGLRVRTCNYLAGLSFFALLPVASAALGCAVGLACALVCRGRLRAFLLGLGLILFSLLWTAQRFLASPAIFAYDPWFGYFPGSLYDEEVTIQPALYAARAYHAVWAAALLLLCASLLDGQRLRLSWHRARGRLLAGGLAGLGLALLLAGRQDRLGTYLDSRAVERTLSQERRTPHFTLRYTPGGAVARDIDLYAREHELRYRQLAEVLGVEPTWPATWQSRLLGLENRHGGIVSYLFESARQKQQLMGAGHTYIAKPWRREIYLQHEAWPHPVLKHELAHVFAGAAGDRLLRGSLHGLVPNVGMIEGLAVAADWDGGRLSDHQATRAMRVARLQPELRRLFGLSFFAVSSGRAYTVAGSFCRYLLERYGPAPLLQVYQAGGSPAAFGRAYGVPFAKLEEGWNDLIERQPLAPQDLAVERERVRRPAVFHKVCAHELAVRRQRAHEATARGDLAQARRLLTSICRDDPGEPRHVLELMEHLWGAGQRAEAEEAARRLLRYREPVLEARAHALLGDAAWLRGDAAAADREYEAALKRPADEGLTRLLLAKRWALSPAGRGAGAAVLRVLVGDPGNRTRDGALDLFTLTQAIEAAPDLGLPRYLLGRQLYNRGGHAEAVPVLRRALELGLPDRRFAMQARRLLGQALLLSGDTEGAQAAFRQVIAELKPEEQGVRIELLDWIDRAAKWPALPASEQLLDLVDRSTNSK
jgi:Flp pilus assembly protein TadD